jgi:hypothetical protein
MDTECAKAMETPATLLGMAVNEEGKERGRRRQLRLWQMKNEASLSFELGSWKNAR